MADDKKQKMMLGIIVLCAVGAGGSYFIFGEKSSTQAPQSQTPAAEKKRRVTAKTDGKKKTRKRTATTSVKEERGEKRVRDSTEKRRGNKKRRKTSGKKKTKQKKLAPMAFNHIEELGEFREMDVVRTFERQVLFIA